MPRPEGHHVVDEGLQPLGDEGLQHVALDRKPQPQHRGGDRGMPGRRQRQLPAADRAAGGLKLHRALALAPDAGHLAMGDHVDAAGRGGARKPPGDSIVAHRAAATLHQPALDRKPRRVEIEHRQHLAQGRHVEDLGVHPVQAHGVAPPPVGVALAVGVEQVDHAPLRDHGVEVQLPLEPLPQLHAQLVERIVPLEQVVGAHDRGVASHVARADVALLQHRHVGDAVLARQVVGGGEPMPPAAHDHHVVGGLGLGLAPGRRPAGVAAQGLAQQAKGGIAAHAAPSAAARRRAPFNPRERNLTQRGAAAEARA